MTHDITLSPSNTLSVIFQAYGTGENKLDLILGQFVCQYIGV